MGNAGTLVFAFGPVYRGPYGGAVDDSAEEDQTVEAPHSGRVKLIRQVVTANTLSGTILISLRVNGVTQSGGSVVTASTTGTFDNTVQAEFKKGDEINIILSATGTGSAAWHYLVEYEWEND